MAELDDRCPTILCLIPHEYYIISDNVTHCGLFATYFMPYSVHSLEGARRNAVVEVNKSDLRKRSIRISSPITLPHIWNESLSLLGIIRPKVGEVPLMGPVRR